MDDNRVEGIEFGTLEEDLEDESYPISKAELLERYGDRELEHDSGAVRLEDVLESEGNDEYRDAEEIRQSVLTMIGDEAVGREGYSDRGPGELESPDDGPESF